MENRPVGRVKRVISGGSGIRKTGNGLGKTVSQRGVKKEAARKLAQKQGLPGGMLPK